jgi:D-alanyl-lipoteichoic acid acyltransferase DltB (MBOAT superfamily)
MNFAEIHFWLYLAFVLGLVVAIRPIYLRCVRNRDASVGLYDRCALLTVGLFLLGCASLMTLGIFLFVCLVTYIGLTLFVRSAGRHRYAFIAVLVPLQLAPLIYYKYAHFLLNDILGQGLPGLSELIIPIGLSFYTFQKVAFVVDTVMHRHPLPSFLDFMNFAAFFPQIVAGPIERRENLLPQMQNFRFRWNAADIDSGVSWIVVGLFFKICLADNLAMHFDPRSPDNPFAIWLNNLIFGLRIYYDFAGYSLVALGIARCLGVTLTLNFASPYLSTNTQEFWRRWHITLSTWFRDYVYLPLGGSRTRLWALTVVLVFVLSGVWHGAGWNFVLWGFVWALLLLCFHAFKGTRLPPALGWVLTMIGAFFAWLCFYETRTPVLLAKLAALLNPLNYTAHNFRQAIAMIEPGNLFVLSVFLALALTTLAVEWASLRRAGEPYSLLRRPAVLCVLVVLIVLLAPSEKSDFIYFAF